MRWLVQAVLLLCAVSGVAAQSAVGTVVEEGTLRPLQGVFVQLLDGQGRRQAAVLSDSSGRFLVRARGPGQYRLRAELIGYATVETEALELASGTATEREIRIPISALTLEGIEVETASRCRRRPGSSEQTARLWDEARRALEVTHWTGAERALRFHVVQHRRSLDARTLRVTAQQESGRSGFYDQSPYRSIPAARLHAGGYVQPDPDGAYDFFAPDAEVLLAETFLDDHCFRVAASPSDDSTLVGLAFEPIPDRTLPDIEGVLWLDRATSELRSLDFRYRSLPFHHDDWSQVGGRVEFERLATGMWIVRRWHIRMPLEARESGGYGGDLPRLSLVTLVEDGAEVREVRTADGRVVAQAAGATLFGTVSRDASTQPLGGAVIEVIGTDRRTESGDDGAFRITGLPGGTYGVRIAHPDLAAMGLGARERTVELVPGRATRLPFAVETSARVAREVCAAGGWDAAGTAAPVLLHGVVRDPYDSPVPNAIVRIEGLPGSTSYIADSTGTFRHCLGTVPTPVRIAASYPDAAGTGAPTEVDLSRAGFVRVDPRAAEAPSALAGMNARVRRSWSNELRGTVRDADAREPIPGVMLALRDTAGTSSATAVSDEAGRFRFPHPGLGDRYRLYAEHVAYGAAQGTLEFRPAEQLDVEVLLAPSTLELDPIVVTERRRGLLADAGFYERRDQAVGVFIERDEIERRVPTRITDLLQGRSRLDVVRRGTGSDVRVRGAGTRLDGRECQPAVWVDGVQVRDGGEPQVVVMTSGNRVYLDILTDLVNPSDVEALEVYTGGAGLPRQFAGSGSDCGVLLVWTRR